MAKANENTPLSELIGGLLSDVTGLLRKEIDLAKTEVSEKVKKALSGAEFLMIGLVLAIGAVGVLLSALVSGLAVVISRYGISEVSANALAAVTVGLVIGAIAWLLISRGITALRGTQLTLDRTTASLRRDAEIVKEKV
ncbi:putative membrane-bound dolichyl-phosphate-mannose-protein mannosyltransferase [Rhizobium sp. BK512]|uniref:phage holin family protein n=1 Tax=Rhizobium sp. BK512 TaxID=2587010 RepID=UPI001619754F|nr:phage holin family protein [Rhizobium sp. BK512]MBB3565295.1 putative membrane-bound dolichyl-phosphate-mannose-protein mannosyltransferase [Rhizobium sp. BK512]